MTRHALCESARLRERLPLREARPMSSGVALDALAREMCDRHSRSRRRRPDRLRTRGGPSGRCRPGVSMRLFNADGSHAEVSGNGVRALGALLLDGSHDAAARARRPHRGRHQAPGPHGARRHAPDVSGGDGTANWNRRAHRRSSAGEPIALVVLNMGNPQAVLLGPLPGPLALSGPRRRARTPRSLSRWHQRRVRAGGGPGPRAHPHLGARRRAHDVVGHRIVRRAGRGRGLRRRRRAAPTSSRPAGLSASSGWPTAST